MHKTLCECVTVMCKCVSGVCVCMCVSDSSVQWSSSGVCGGGRVFRGGGQGMGGGFSLQLLHPPLQLCPQDQQVLQSLMHRHLWSHAWVPASVVAAPQLQMSGRHQRIQNVVLIVHIEGVGEVLGLAVNVGPQGHSAGLNVLGCPFLFAVIEECTKQTAVQVVQHCDEEQLVELKGCWELTSHLPDAVHELDEERRAL